MCYGMNCPNDDSNGACIYHCRVDRCPIDEDDYDEDDASEIELSDEEEEE